MCRVPVLISAWSLQASDSSEAEFVLKLCHESVSEEFRAQNTVTEKNHNDFKRNKINTKKVNMFLKDAFTKCDKLWSGMRPACFCSGLQCSSSVCAGFT